MKTRGLPHSKDCFVCGEDNPDGFRLRFEVDDNDHVYLKFNARQSMQGYGTVMHGGLQATLMDETMGWASSVGSKRMTVAAELNVRYLSRTPLKTPLVVEAWATRVTRKLIVTEAILRDEEGSGEVHARATGKFFPLSEEETKFVDSHLIYQEGDKRIFNFEDDCPLVPEPI